ncbi:hypothetical protein ACT80S_14815 [Ramlibacter sp. MAHUQ-53]|uniref:hypothetical protein n=1 Tax=unclassified Ramlibacter TaxID=2617605 RepID=UPI003627D42F
MSLLHLPHGIFHRHPAQHPVKAAKAARVTQARRKQLGIRGLQVLGGLALAGVIVALNVLLSQRTEQALAPSEFVQAAIAASIATVDEFAEAKLRAVEAEFPPQF